MLRSIRFRLAMWHLLILAVLQIGLCSGLYFALYARMLHDVDEVLRTVLNAAETNLRAELQQGGDAQRAATVALDTLIHAETPVVVLTGDGRLLAERPSGAGRITPLPKHAIAPDTLDMVNLRPNPSQRIGVRRVAAVQIHAGADGERYFVAASQSLDASLAQFHAARLSFLFAVPILLGTTALGGWLLAGRSLAPATEMSDRARHIDANDLSERIQAAHPHDELGKLAASFNELLDRVAAASARERQFMADAAHELRTPVAVIQTSVDVALSRAQRTNEEYRNALQAISTYAQKLTRGVDGVFRLARADAGFKALNLRPVYLEEIVADAVMAARVLAAGKEIEVELDALTESPFRGDEALLNEMLVNLLENAVKYTPAQGRIRVDMQATVDAYRITVTDTGVGIAEQDQARIFDRFFRGASVSGAGETACIAGSGLGLSIAQWIAGAHGGTLDLQHSGAGGSSFAVMLPRA